MATHTGAPSVNDKRRALQEQGVIALMLASTLGLFWVDLQLTKGHLDGYPYFVPMLGAAFVRKRNFAYFCLPLLIGLAVIGAHHSDGPAETVNAETIAVINLVIASGALAGMAYAIERSRRLNLRLQAQVRQLRQAEHERQELMAIIAHDLRSPLNPIIGFASLIGERFDRLTREKVIEYAGSIQTSARSLQAVLEQLLDWVRTNADGDAVKRESANLVALAEDALRLLRPVAAQKGIQLDLETTDATVACDPVAVSTVIRNVVGNAIKFSPREAVIKVSVGNESDCSFLKVVDRGVGIPKAVVDQVLVGAPIKSRTGTAGEKGTGLGLRICRTLMERNGGSLKLDSTEGTGTSVLLCFCP